MATRPDTSPEWATDENFDATGEAWDGLPTKVDPGAALREEGWEPEQRPAAEHVNFQLNLQGAWLAFLMNVAIANWHEVPVIDGNGGELWGTSDMDLRCGVYVSTTSSGAGALFLFGEFDSVSGDTRAAVSVAGGAWTDPPETVDATADPVTVLAAVHDTTNGVLIVCGVNAPADGMIFTRPAADAPLGTWTQRLSVANITFRGLAHGASASGAVTSIAVGELTTTNDARIYSSDLGTGWTNRDTTANQPLYGVANKPGVCWVAVGDDTAGNAIIMRSADGITWSTITHGLGVDTLRKIVWDARAGLFLAIGDNGSRCTSPDGTKWVDRTDTGVAWLASDPTDMATDGAGTILVLSNSLGWRVYASTDGGLTFTAGHQIQRPGSPAWGDTTIRGLCWGGPSGWVIMGDVFPALGAPVAWFSLAL